MDRSFFTRNLWIYYIAFWVAVAAIQFALAFQVYNLEVEIALTDSLITNTVFALLGVGLWFMVRFSGKQIRGFLKNLVYHLTGCAFTILIWQIISYSILSYVFESNKIYVDFLQSSLIVRVITGVLIYFLLISIDFLIMSFEEMQERAEHEASLAAMLRDAELTTLRSQIKPHFLFNSLNSVSALTLSNPEAAQQMILKLSEFMRHSLSQVTNAMSTMEEELHHVGLYLEIEKVRFSDRLMIETRIDEKCNSMLLPAMILQPLVENAVKHGANSMLTVCKIEIHAECQENKLFIIINNQFDADGLPRKGTGTGLKNVKQRLMSTYGRNDLLTTKSESGWFRLSLAIPQLKQESEVI